MLEIQVAGETLVLLPERAVWWPRGASLVLADPHFGKDASFRAAGLAVPSGATEETLLRLQGLMRQWPVRELIVLGDFFHSVSSKNLSTLSALRQWYTEQRESRPEFRWHLVPGNHDQHAGSAPADLGLEVHTDPWFCPPWNFTHAPSRLGKGFSLCGHLHPVIRLKKRKIDSVRLPCFWFQDHCAVLPAFGAFTGGGEIDFFTMRAQDRVFVVADQQLWPLTHFKQKIGTI